MTPFRRVFAVAIVLLSQVASGFAVLCEEDSGGRVMEVFPGVCCDGTEDSAPTDAPAPDAPHDCGECLDQALTRLIPGQGDDRAHTLPPAPQEHCALLTPVEAPTDCTPAHAGHDALPASPPTTVAQLLVAVVMHC